MGKRSRADQEALTTSRSNYEVEQATMPYIDDQADWDLQGNVKPAKRLSQVRLEFGNSYFKQKLF